MPNRVMKDTILTSRSVDLLSEGAENLLHRLILVADDYGRFDASPKVLLARCFPMKVGDWKPERIEKLRNEVVAVGTIELYEHRGTLLGAFPRWREHQRERTSKPKFAGPDDEGSVRVDPQQLAARCGETPPSAARARRRARPASESRESRDESRETRVGVPPPPVAAAVPEGAGVATWIAYSRAYHDRYGTDPVRNARVNAKMLDLVRLLGADEAPSVAEFYVHHNGAYYVARGHPPEAMVADAGKLRTEWATGKRINAAQARRDESAAANPFLALVAEERAKAAGGDS